LAAIKPFALDKGRYRLNPGREYELVLYHFYPRNVPLDVRLSFNATSEWLSFTTNPVLCFDSRYDLKRVRFKVGKPANEDKSVISVLRGAGSNQLPLDFDLWVVIQGAFWRTAGMAVLLGVFLAGPQIVATLSNPNLPQNNVVLVCLTSALLGLGAGVAAAFGLKRSP
jgi:hypothetical protein